jgi:hypothetical protein
MAEIIIQRQRMFLIILLSLKNTLSRQDESPAYVALV